MMIEPFLKWPGGKRWLIRNFKHLFPTAFDRYIEPFLGAGAVFFSLQPSNAILSDTNSELINAYRVLKTDFEKIEVGLAKLERKHGKTVYYDVRDSIPTEPVKKAIRFIYLNRTCFNGLYRVNLRGEFNVPMGTKTAVSFPAGFLEKISSALKNSVIRVSDFEQTLDRCGEGDLVFIDPPYTVMHNNNNFVKYNKHLFSWADQVRLAAAARRAAGRKARVVIANADHHSIRSLYSNFGTHHSLSRSSVLAADACSRRGTSELLIVSER